MISTLVLIGVVISLAITLSVSSGNLLEAWQMVFSHTHDMQVTIVEVRNLLLVSALYFLIILAPIFLVVFMGRFERNIMGSGEIDQGIRPILKSFYIFCEVILIALIFFSYLYLNFDHILSVRNLPVEKIFSFIFRIIIEIVSLTIIIKILIISSRLFKREPKSH